VISSDLIIKLFILSALTQSSNCFPNPHMQSESIPASAAVQTSKTLIFQSLMEHPQSGWNVSEGGDWSGVEAGPLSIKRSREKVRNGNYSAKFILNKSDPESGKSKRTELTDWNGRMTDPISERWYGLSMFLPTSYITDPCEEIVFQWHGVNALDLNGNSMKHPPIAMLTRNGCWELMVRGTKINLGAYEKNAWTDWVLHIKFSYLSDGQMQIWKNGKLVLTRTNQPNSYNDLVGNYFKIGIYKYGWKDGYPTTTTSRSIFYDEIRIGNENSSYAEVVPRSSTDSTRL
jgi:hypothetical protein